MREQIKNSIKQILNNYDSINDDCLYGFIVSEFILQKKVIKKIQYSGEPEMVIFDYSENYEAIVSIKDLVNCIRDGLKNLENINMNVFVYTYEEDSCIDVEVLKKDIALVHNFRNMLAHGFF